MAGQVEKRDRGRTDVYQAQLRRADELAELDRAKTEFFTGVSHELRTPLMLIAGPAEDGLADLDEPLPPAQRSRMEVIARSRRVGCAGWWTPCWSSPGWRTAGLCRKNGYRSTCPP